ncbi:GNAT family N-acetyltransferase [Micromonospora sp. NPDC050397]|uniref:GNAT family N-acetyltransferase n=1 Tax=Micromonospora sp. NPDC050397 TaxID=3364279 RepID=UPI00384C9D42
MSSLYAGSGRDPGSAEALAEAWFVALSAKIDATPDARFERGSDGVHLVVTGVLMPTGNGVFTTATNPDPQRVAALADKMVGRGLPWSIQVRGEPDAELVRLAAGYGLTARVPSPLMSRSAPRVPAPTRAGDAVGAAGSDTARVRPATGADGPVYANLIATALGLPRPVIGEFASAPVLEAPGITGYLVEWDGVAAGTGLSTRFGEHLGVYNITVPPAFRRRGFARLVSETVLRDGFASGAQVAFLHASAQAQSLYESLGFRTVETWTYLVPDAS